MPHSIRQRSLWYALVAVGGCVVLAGTWVLARDRAVHPWENSLFSTINLAPSWLYPIVWPVMQLGNFLVATAIVLVVFALFRSWRPAVAVAVAALSGWLLAKLVKNLVERGRPNVYIVGTSQRDAESGFGFVSGHAAVTFAMATVLAPYLPRRWRWVPFVLAGVVAFARMYVGVHLPLDVIGGAALGVAIGALVNLVFGTPATDETATTRP